MKIEDAINILRTTIGKDDSDGLKIKKVIEFLEDYKPEPCTGRFEVLKAMNEFLMTTFSYWGKERDRCLQTY